MVYDEPANSSRSTVKTLPETTKLPTMSTVLFSHATGFHGRVFAPVAAHLSGFDRTTFDYRGYGDTVQIGRAHV